MNSRLRISVLAGGLALGLASAANAHIVITNMNQPAGWEGAVLTLLIPHGCGTAPTTSVRMKVPENVNVILPEPKQGWDIKITKRKLDQPKKVGNREITEVQDEVIWSGNSLSNDNAGLFTFVTNFPDKPGERIYFKTIQTCGTVEEKWVDTVKPEEEIWRTWLNAKPSPFVVLVKPAQPQLFATMETIMGARKQAMAAEKK